MPTSELHLYKSPSQQARVCTEPWAHANLYCPACDSRRIESLRANTPAHDFKCPRCESWFQLKSKSSSFGNRVQDGAYETMRRSILKGQTPNLFLLQYERPAFVVRALTLIPHFAFSVSVLEKRKPLSAQAERHDWVGCNFLLNRIPVDARISVIANGRIALPSEVREAYGKMKRLEKLTAEKRGWTLDVLNVVRSLNKKEFELSEVCEHEGELAALHPRNHHIKEKIRQQLQELRKLNLLEFLSPGHYRVRRAL